jgi:Spy/CpxP family protein refolding chaperone
MRMMLLALVAASLAACANEVTAPALSPSPENSLATVGGDTAGRGMWGFGRHGYGMMGGGFFFARRLPANLQLSDAQRTQIKSLMTAYRTAHQDDLKSLATIIKQARAAHVAGQRVSADQRRALLAQTAPARQRLTSANKQLASDIQQVLTADQQTWLATHHPTFRRTTPRARRST